MSSINLSSGDKENRAVSPVIGVILMVAITVILAAVIAAFVLDIGQMDEPPQASIEVNEDDSGHLDITVQDASRVDDIEVRGCPAGTFSLVSGSITETLPSDISVGSGATIEATDSPDSITDFSSDCGGNELNFVAIYNGEDQIISSFNYEG